MYAEYQQQANCMCLFHQPQVLLMGNTDTVRGCNCLQICQEWKELQLVELLVSSAWQMGTLR